MEDPIYKSSSTENQNENVNLSVDREGLLHSTTVFPLKDISPESEGSLEITIKDESNKEINGYVNISQMTPPSCESIQLETEKTCSPTFIESAIQVMKNFFSPEKIKSKSSSTMSLSNNSKNPSESPIKSISSNILGKADFLASESQNDNHSNVQFTPGENGFKNYSQNNESETFHTPLILDPLNNTDESFMTTVSLIDDSFHSAVTNLDEHGEFLRNSVNLKENILNNSRNSDFIDPFEDTLENNESCLENTTLRIHNFSSDGMKLPGLSLDNKDGFIKNFSSTQIVGENSEKVSVTQPQYGNSLIKDSKNEVLENVNENREEADQDVGFEDKPLAPPSDSNHEVMAVTYLNKSFAKQTPIPQNKVLPNGLDQNTPKEITEMFKVVESETDKQIEGSCVENSISTTTVVLNTGESVDLENMLMSLKEDGSSTNASILTLESDDVISSLENEIPQSDTSCGIVLNSFLLAQQRRACVSEGNSPNRSESCKTKLNKSDEILNRRVCSEPFEKNSDNSAADFLLMKYSEASKMSKKSDNVKYSHNFKQPNAVENNKSEVDSPSKTTDSVPIVSQQSYTILTVHDKTLNRPVIEPLNVSNDLSEQQAFQKNDSEPMLTTELGVVEKNFGNNSLNGSFDNEDLVKSAQVKQSTPLWEGSKETGEKFFRPTTLKLNSPDIPESVCDETKIIENLAERKKAKKIFPTNESIDGFSSVNPDDNINVVFANTIEDETSVNDVISSSKEQNKISPGVKSRLKKSPDDASEKLNQTFDKKSAKSKNQPSNKKSESRTSHPLNQTFEKKFKSPSSNGKNRSPNEHSQTPKQDKLNTTFDVNTRSPNSNKTFTKETESPEIGEVNLTYNKSDSVEVILLNKTFDKALNNQLNQTFSKQSPGPQKFNETFDKNSESSLPDKMIQVSDGIMESPFKNESNQTFVLDNYELGKAEQESIQTTKTVDVESSDMFGSRLETVLKIDNDLEEDESKTEANTFQKPPPNEVQPQMSSNFPTAAALHYRNNIAEWIDHNEANDSFVSSKSSNTSLFCSDMSTVVFNKEEGPGNRSLDDLSGKLEKMNLNENTKQDSELCFPPRVIPSEGISFLKDIVEEQNLQTEENLLNCLKDDKLRCDSDLVQLIREQFSSNDIEKICSVVQDLSSAKLTNEILKASERLDKSFHGTSSDVEFKVPEVELRKEKAINALSPQSFDFLNSIGGKPTGRDLSRESLYVKFDPLVQPSANSLIDFTKEGEALADIDASPVSNHSSSICEQLLTISPQKKPDAIVPPLTPLSHKVKADCNEEKLERLKELQNEIYFLKNLYAERERANKTKMEEYESQIAKLTGESCMLEDKLKESNEREKSLVKKMREQTQSIGQLKIVMEEYVKVISKLSSELETIKNENVKQLETLSLEKDSYMTHLQNTEAAFTDVHAKYEKSKKTIVNLKANEVMYRNTIAEQVQKMEEFKSKAIEAQEKALMKFQKYQEELNQVKASHSQEAARLKAQLRKTELKVEALQESLDQKIKENQQLTAICDELIEGRK